MSNKGKVLVTGASGFIASHVINELLRKGYNVVGTVRSLDKKQKYQFLLQLPHAKQRLEFREADLMKPESWDSALQGIDTVFHIASPIPPGIPQNEDELIKPAVQGTKNVVQGCIRQKVRRIIFTSSCLTIAIRSDGKIPSEQDWSDINLLHHYPKSKYLAQKTFWELAEKYKDQLEFVSVLPSLVLGPAFTKHGNSSEAFISDILNGGYPGIPTPSAEYSTVDVRDLAVAQVKAMEYPQAKGRRWIASGDRIRTHEIFQILSEKYEKQGFKFPTNKIDAQGIKKSGHGPSMRTLFLLGKRFEVNNKRSNDELGLTFRPVKESIIDQAEKQIEIGIVKKP